MKLQHRHTRIQCGFTLPEMIVSIGILGILGGVFFQVLNSGLILFAKNTAVNSAHEEARQGINRLTRDIHAAISVPQLRSLDPAYAQATGNIPIAKFPVASSPSQATAGVSFQNIASGPNYVWKDTPNSKIMIKDGTITKLKPEEGMRLVVPLWGLEEDITKQSSNGPHSNVWTTVDETTPTITGAPEWPGATGTSSTFAVTYYTDRVAYIVKNGTYVPDAQGPWIAGTGGEYVLYTSGAMQRYRYENGELHFYKQRYTSGLGFYWKDEGVVAHYISSPKPFYVPLTATGGVNNKFVGVKLTARDPKSSNRAFLSTAALLDTQIDYRSRVCLYQ